jgi:hypothetical protein
MPVIIPQDLLGTAPFLNSLPNRISVMSNWNQSERGEVLAWTDSFSN